MSGVSAPRGVDGRVPLETIGGKGAAPGQVPFWDGMRHVPRTPTPVIFSNPAPVAGTSSPPYIVHGAAVLIRLRVALGTAGSTSTTVNLKVNGTTQATVTLASSVTSGSASVSVVLADGDILTVGSSAVGTSAANLTAQAYLA